MKHLDKILFVVCLAFYAWGFIDHSFRHWSMIGGFSTFLALIFLERKKKGQPLLDVSAILLITCVLVMVGFEIADFFVG